MRKNVIVMAMLFIGASGALAEHTLESWGDGVFGTDFTWDPASHTIMIVTGNGLDYRFWVHDGSEDPNTGVINNITVYDPNDNIGDFSLLIGYPLDPNDPNSDVDPNKPGALHWIAGDLTYDGGTSTILGIYLGGNIVGSRADENVICDVINGDINVSGVLAVGYGGAPEVRKLQANSITGDITLGGMVGDIETGSLDGDVEVGDSAGGGYTPGDFAIGSDYDGTMLFTDPDGYNGAILIEGDFGGSITVEKKMLGNVEIDGDMMAPCRIWFKRFTSRSDGSEPPSIHVHGSIIGSTTGDPVIELGDEEVCTLLDMDGTIAIDGSLTNAVTDGPEIKTREIDHGDRGAIVIDYDGWDPNDVWDPNATVLVYRPACAGDPFTSVINGNEPNSFVYRVTWCIGDLDNDGLVDDDDVTAMGYAILYPGDDEFVDRYPGLEGSLHFHADIDCDGSVTEYDPNLLDFFVDKACCFATCEEEEFPPCRIDFNNNGTVDLSDLARLLGAYDECVGDDYYDPLVDLMDFYDCITLSDLAAVLGVYGAECQCPESGRGAGAGGDGGNGRAVSVAVEPYDTDGYAAKGFAGERDHFVFDLTIELDDADDDWTTSGAVVTAENGAAFRLAATPTASDPYASFVSTPRVADADADSIDSGASLIGAYLPPDADYEFDSSVINISWFDLVELHDGPAGVMRLVIDVSGVADADTTGGLGSVYFSQTGPASVGDIKLADFSSATSIRTDAAAMSTHNGAFFVKVE